MLLPRGSRDGHLELQVRQGIGTEIPGVMSSNLDACNLSFGFGVLI